jgi:phosphoglucosamine mutase
VVEAIDHGRQRLGKDGRLVIRASGTEPMIRIMAQGDDEKLITSVVEEIAGAVSQIAA